MSVTIDRITESAVAACWRQWSSLRALGSTIGHAPARAIIDPEALLLLSLCVRREERRLQEALLWCASVGSTLLSVQRTQTLCKQLPGSIRSELSWFAASCIKAGDRRWRTLTRSEDNDPATISGRSDKGPDALRLLDPSTLLLQLRAGFGVGAKADLLAFLIGIAATVGRREAWASADVIAKGISYSEASVRRAAGDMVLGRFVRASGDRPMEYTVDAHAWAHLLDLRAPGEPRQPTIPPWRFWSQMFAFLVHTIEWANETRAHSPTVQASRARDLADAYRQVFRWNDIRIGDAQRYPGPRYLEAFQELLAKLEIWIEEHV